MNQLIGRRGRHLEFSRMFHFETFAAEEGVDFDYLPFFFFFFFSFHFNARNFLKCLKSILFRSCFIPAEAGEVARKEIDDNGV